MGTIARERKRISVIGNVIREFSSLLELGEETSMEGNKGINVSTDGNLHDCYRCSYQCYFPVEFSFCGGRQERPVQNFLRVNLRLIRGLLHEFSPPPHRDNNSHWIVRRTVFVNIYNGVEFRQFGK